VPGLLPRGMLGGALSFVQIMRELDLNEIRQQLVEPVRIQVTGSDVEAARQLAERLFGQEGLTSRAVAVNGLDEPSRIESPGLVLLTIGATENPLDLVDRLRRDGSDPPTPIVAVRPRGALGDLAGIWEADRPAFRLVRAESEAGDLLERVTRAVLELVPDQAMALGRRFPSFRQAVAEQIIRDTSRVNAEFALVSSLPAMIPVVGGLASGAADTVVLTKNQAMLVYKLAGLHGRDLNDYLPLALEIAPVVGGAFLWRSVARALLGMLPTIVGGVPKAAVAFAGTYAVGEMARYYYNTGQRPSPELAGRIQQEGARLATSLIKKVRERREPE
jgi:uncharacterized protein (DUF697 family)/CheY-like chemotaxis protein